LLKFKFIQFNNQFKELLKPILIKFFFCIENANQHRTKSGKTESGRFFF